ncbi:MAG TPA: beta-propeller fold lactonase family protein [Myxococcaceae bacterium]|nr:beta-propeller fold lactonase family protein [Myxococcaceae bacterium]
MARLDVVAAAAVTLFVTAAGAHEPIPIPTGQRITPTAAPGSTFTQLNPGLPGLPGFTAGQAVSTALSPDGKTLLVLTSGFNRWADASGNGIPQDSNEYVFVFEVSGRTAVQKQALQIPNTYDGIVFAPDGSRFYVSGGVDDDVHVFARSGGGWAEDGAPIALNHPPGNGLLPFGFPPLGVPPTVGAHAAGIDVTSDGKKLVVANYENDSISVVDLLTRKRSGELDLRPGKTDSSKAGVPGGEFPFWVSVKGNGTAYVSSLRDREVVVVDFTGAPKVTSRIPLEGNPNKMLLDRRERRLFVAADNADVVYVIDTGSNRVLRRLSTSFPGEREGDDDREHRENGEHRRSRPRKGASPNSLALSPDERTLYVTNGGSNSLAVIDLDEDGGELRGLIPTGWYPSSVSVSRDGRTLWVVNAKSNAGPNPKQCATAFDNIAPGCPDSAENGSSNQYVLQLTKAGFLTIPVPNRHELEELTEQTARNNDAGTGEEDREVMRELRKRIRHVIYIVKENRTYDQILGDTKGSNGDPAITQFPRSITPNFHALAERFVNLDNFYASGEVSMDGWQWATAARSSDANEKAFMVNYAGRGLTYDSEGLDRDINIALPTSAERQKIIPISPLDPDILPGTANEVELDAPDGEPGAGYLWNAALRAGKTVRNYGFFIDLVPYSAPPSLGGVPPSVRYPFAAGIPVASAANAVLRQYTDVFFRGFDPAQPDFYREAEWAREFDGFVAGGNLPALSLVRLMNDHTGSFGTAIDGVNTPELQHADNDYAVGLLVEKVATSPYAKDTLIFVLEDDSQDGPDHVDAHRSTAYVVGPYVKHRAVVSGRYSTVSMLRTIEDVLGLEHLNLHDHGVRPMTKVFDLRQEQWDFHAVPSSILVGTKLPLPKSAVAEALTLAPALAPTHDAGWWAQATKGMDFTREDRVDAATYNRLLWKGLMGDRPYPEGRTGQGPRSTP